MRGYVGSFLNAIKQSPYLAELSDQTKGSSDTTPEQDGIQSFFHRPSLNEKMVDFNSEQSNDQGSKDVKRNAERTKELVESVK